MAKMLVVGSVAFDTLHHSFGSFPKVLGGSATYASLAASVFTDVQLVGVVGQDFPADAMAMLRSRGVDLEGLEIADGKTFHWEGRYSEDLTSRTSLATDLNVFADFHPKIPESFRDTPFVLLGNIDPDLQIEVLDQVRKPVLVVADTMNFWIDGKLDALKKMLARVDLLVINEEEARQLAGAHQIKTVARRLMDMGPARLVIKQGEYGALLFDRDDVFSAPALPLDDVRDPTGAGDTFAGGMLGYIAKVESLSPDTLRRAVIYGSVLASACVESVAVDGLAATTADDVSARFYSFKQLAHFAVDDELAQSAAENAQARELSA